MQVNEQTALAALAQALENAKWKLPPAIGELTAFLQRELSGVRREVLSGSAFVSPEKTAALRRTTGQLAQAKRNGAAGLEASPEAAAAMTAACTAAAEAETLADPARKDWLQALTELIGLLAQLCAAENPAPANVTSAQAQAICDGVLTRAKSMGLKLVAAVCDAGGNLLALRRDDGAFIASIDIAQNKAFTAVSLQMPTKALAELALPGAPLYGIQHTNNGRIVIFGGGVPIVRAGCIIGGFGVSGGTAEQDTEMGDFAARLAEAICSVG